MSSCPRAPFARHHLHSHPSPTRVSPPRKVAARTPPADIVAEIREVLDDEAEIFVMKMWRVVAYETEFKREGLGER